MNKLFFVLFALAALGLPLLAVAQGDLSHYRGKNRLLLVFAPSESDPRWQKQNQLLQHSQAAFQDRDLVRLDYLETGGVVVAAVRAHYGLKPGQFRVLLVGKDGHVASGGPAPIGISELTQQIDRMPMRREEIRQRGR